MNEISYSMILFFHYALNIIQYLVKAHYSEMTVSNVRPNSCLGKELDK